MWEHCGVVRDKISIEVGILKLKELKNNINDLDVRIDAEGYQDLVLAYDVEASIMSAEATLKTALERRESRGAHQRKDYPNTVDAENINYVIRLSINNEIEINRRELIVLRSDLESEVKVNSNVFVSKDKLLE